MNFDIFDDIEVPNKYRGKVINGAKAAERNINVSPYNALLNARVSLENLCKSLIHTKNLPKLEDDNGSLAMMIERCAINGAIKQKDKAHKIKDNGNIAAHGNNDADKLHIVNIHNVELATESVRYLFDIFSEIFPEKAAGISFDENKIPFGFYEIVRAVPKVKNEIIFGKYNYFVKDPKNNYYYFQIYPRNSESVEENDLGERSILTGNRIREDKKRTSYLLDVYYPSNLMAESDRDYVAYSVYSDSMLLSEVKSGTLSEKNALQIGIDLLNVLSELKAIGNGINLRNIQPGNVIITPDGDSYQASVVNMESAKIISYAASVYGSMDAILDNNFFLPREVRNKETNRETDWEKVDVYSVAALMVYCLDQSAVKAIMDTDVLYDSFSEDVADILADIFDSALNEIDTVAEFMEKLEDALKEL